MQQPSERPAGPVERLSDARVARDRSQDEREVRARKAWVEYVERTDGV